MKGRVSQIVLLILSVGLLGAAAASLVRPLHATIPLGHSKRLVISLVEARCRFVHVSAVYNMSFPGETPLDSLAKTWKTIPVQPLTWQSINYALTDEGQSHTTAISFPLFAPTILAFLLFWMGRVRAKRPGRLVRLFIELVRPSDRFFTGRCRRLVRRSFVLICCFGATLIAAVMFVPNQLLAQLPRSFKIGPMNGNVITSHSLHSIFVFWGHPSFTYSNTFISPFDAKLHVSHSCRAQKDAVPKSRKFALAGFRCEQGTYAPYRGCGVGAPQLTQAEQSYLDQTVPYQLSATIPLSIPLTLSLMPPLVLFVRGPWRRSKRALYGWCLKCGYDLTGLIEPRCPECGTPTPSASPFLKSAAPTELQPQGSGFHRDMETP